MIMLRICTLLWILWQLKVLASNIQEQLRVATWDLSGLCNECKQKEVGELLAIILMQEL